MKEADDGFPTAVAVLKAISTEADVPRNTKRAALKALDNIDIVRGWMRRVHLSERLNALGHKKPDGVTPPLPFQSIG